MIRYELFFLFGIGYRPVDVIRKFGISKSSAYRNYHNYREARIRAQKIINLRISVSPADENKPNTLDEANAKKRTPRKREKDKPTEYYDLSVKTKDSSSRM